jgi:hypothetical protein
MDGESHTLQCAGFRLPGLADLLRGLASRIPVTQLLDLLERLPRP